VGNGVAEGTLMAELEDGTIVLVKVTLTSVEEAGFSPLGGVKFSAKTTTDVISMSPQELKEKVKDRPVHYPQQQLPADGWEIVDIKWQKPAVIETTVNTSKGLFSVRIVTEATMAARNMSYRLPSGDPIYYVAWVYKAYWRPQEREATERLKRAEMTTKYASPGEPTYIYRVN
jgi:hypothetical protein